MKTLINYINNEFIIEELFNIDSEIICESLNCTVLKEVAAQLLNYNKDEQARIDKVKKEKEEAGQTYWGSDKAKSKKFSQIFSGESFSVQWDKITDKDVEVIDSSSWSEFEGRNSANIRKVINTKKTAMLIVQDPESKEYEFFITCGGRLISLSRKNYMHNVGDDWERLNQRDKINMCKNKTLYFIDTTGKSKELVDLKYKRYEQKQGMINMDPYSLAQIAKNNKERYQKIIAKMKSMNINNDPLLNKCNNVIKRITDLAIELAKDPVSNADMLTGISYIMPWVCDTRRWAQSGKYTGEYKGVNGLLPRIVEYSRTLKYVASEGSSYYLKEVNNIKADIEKALTKIDDLAKKYNINLNP